MTDRNPKPCHHQNVTHEHGTHRCYEADACRCWECVAAYCKRSKRQRDRQRAGIRMMIDADPARTHLHALRGAGLSVETIIRLSGTSNGVIQALLYGNRNRVTRSVMRRIMAVPVAAQTVATAPPFGSIPSIGSRRRLHALCVQGWPLNRVAAFTGLSKRTLSEMAWRDVCTPAAHQAIAAVYDRLWNVEPPMTTRQEKVVAVKTRNWANRNGWAPAMAWNDDTIDDPRAEPDTGDPDDLRVWRGRRMRALYNQGLSDEAIGDRLGYSRDTVRHWRLQTGLPPSSRRGATRTPLGEEGDQRYELWLNGYPDQDIAQLIGRHVDVIRRWRKKHGLNVGRKAS